MKYIKKKRVFEIADISLETFKNWLGKIKPELKNKKIDSLILTENLFSGDKWNTFIEFKPRNPFP